MENKVDTKIIWLAKRASAPYLSARIDAVEPAGIPDIITEMLRIRGFSSNGFSAAKTISGNRMIRMKVNKNMSFEKRLLIFAPLKIEPMTSMLRGVVQRLKMRIGFAANSGTSHGKNIKMKPTKMAMMQG